MPFKCRYLYGFVTMELLYVECKIQQLTYCYLHMTFSLSISETMNELDKRAYQIDK